MGSGDKSTNEWADNRQTMAPGARLGSRGIFASSARRSVSEGGFEPPRPIRPLGPQPVGARCSACCRVSPSVAPCLDASDLVVLTAARCIVFASSWGNPWGNV